MFIYIAVMAFIYVRANETPDFIYKTCSSDGLRFLFFENALSFQEAKIFCQSLSPSSDIVKVTDEATFDILKVLPDVPLFTSFWLDFQRVDEDLPVDNPLSYGIQQGDFGSVGGQHPWSFFGSDPNGEDENCIEMFPTTLDSLSWFTTSCEVQNIFTVCSQPCENIESECDTTTEYKYTYVIDSGFRSLAQESCESLSDSTTLARPTTTEEYSLLSDFAFSVTLEDYSYWLDYRHSGSGNKVNPLNYGLEADGFAHIEGEFPWEDDPIQPDFEGARKENLCVVADAVTQLWRVEQCEDEFDFSIICQTPCDNELPSPTQGPSFSPTTTEPTQSPSFSPTTAEPTQSPSLSPTQEPEPADESEEDRYSDDEGNSTYYGTGSLPGEYEDEKSDEYDGTTGTTNFNPPVEPIQPIDYNYIDEYISPIDDVTSDEYDTDRESDEDDTDRGSDEDDTDRESDEDDSVEDNGNNGDDESSDADDIQFLLILFALSILVLAAVVEVRKAVQESKNKKLKKTKKNENKSGIQSGYQSSYLELTADSEI